MEAIRDAARTLGTRDLDGCIIYATSRPCRMCETAAYWANISYIYYGDALNDGGRPRYSSVKRVENARGNARSAGSSCKAPSRWSNSPTAMA